MKHFFTSVVVAALFFLGLIFSAPEAAADYDSSNFGSLSLSKVMTLCRTSVESNKGSLGGSYTDYYTCSCYYQNGYYRYFVVFYQSDNINMSGSDPFTYNQSSSIKANIRHLECRIVDDGNNNVSIAGTWNSSSNVNYSFVTGCFFTKPDIGGNFFSTITINCLQASQYNISPTVVYQDSFFCRSELDSFTINAAVLPTTQSRFNDVNYYYYTDEYYFEIWVPHDFEHSIANISYTPKRYKYWEITKTYGAGTLIDVSGASDDSLDVPYADRKAHYTNYKYLRELLYAPSTTNLPVPDDDLISTASVYNIYFDDILAGLQEAYPDYGITFKDLYSNITFNFRSASSGEIVYSQSFDYSEAKGHDSTDSDYVPPIHKDPSDYDTTKDPDPQDKPFEFGLASSYDYDSPPDLPEFDFSASFTSEVVDSTSFIKAFFDRLLDSSGLTGFFIAVLSLSAAGWFVFGNFRG